MELTARLHSEDIRQIIDGVQQKLSEILRTTTPQATVANVQQFDKNDAPQHLRAQVMDRKQIEAVFSVGNAQLVKFRQAGLLTPVKFGLKYYYKRAEIEAILGLNESKN